MIGEYAVPEGDAPARCAHCGRPFRRERALALHRGQAHAHALSETEQSAFESARAAESTDLRKFRLKALGGLVLLYFGLLMTYAIV